MSLPSHSIDTCMNAAVIAVPRQNELKFNSEAAPTALNMGRK